MKKVLFVLFLMLATYTLEAQVQFMGIPVDGKVSEMKKQLKKKGFKNAPSDYGDEALVGKFYNREVLLMITKNNKNIVCGVGVFFMKSISEYEGYDRTSTIKLYNELKYSFDNNENYLEVSPLLIESTPGLNYDRIEPDTDLWSDIKVKGVDYHSIYKQIPYEDFNAVHFSITTDNFHYGMFQIILYYENLKNKTFGDEDL